MPGALGLCPNCGHLHQLKSNGTLVRHTVKGKLCWGSGKKPGSK